MLNQSNHNPRVSLPIVAGEYMRATGFLYESKSQLYLVTAKHNILPTEICIPNPRTGENLWEVDTDFAADRIDMFLPDGTGWVYYRVLLSDIPEGGIVTAPATDAIALQLPPDIATYDLTVFSSEDLGESSGEGESLVTFGYGDDSLPSKTTEYSASRFPDELRPPQELKFSNVTFPEDVSAGLDGAFGIGLDENRSETQKYNGLSGAPVLGDGLVGIHSGTSAIPEAAIEQDSSLANTVKINYFGTRFLRKVGH